MRFFALELDRLNITPAFHAADAPFCRVLYQAIGDSRWAVHARQCLRPRGKTAGGMEVLGDNGYAGGWGNFDDDRGDSVSLRPAWVGGCFLAPDELVRVAGVHSDKHDPSAKYGAAPVPRRRRRSGQREVCSLSKGILYCTVLCSDEGEHRGIDPAEASLSIDSSTSSEGLQ